MERGQIMGAVGAYNHNAMNAGFGSLRGADACIKQSEQREIPRHADDLDKWLAAIQQGLSELEEALGCVLRSELPAAQTGAQPCESASTMVGGRLLQFADRAQQAHSQIQSVIRRLEL